MAGISKTENYQLTIFEEQQDDTMTFLKFRTMLAGNGKEADNTLSNMQIIDKVLKQASIDIKENLIQAQNYTKEAIAQLKKDSEGILKEDPDKIVIGGGSKKPIEFDDGSKITTIKDGVITTAGAKLDFLRIRDYLIQYNISNKHLQLTYKPEKEEIK